MGDAWAARASQSVYQHLNLEEEVKTRRRRSRGWGMLRQFIYPEHQPTAHCLKDKGSECFMPDGKQRQQFKTICIQHVPSSASTSLFLCPDWYWNIIHLERRLVIIFLSGLPLPIQDSCKVGKMFYFSQSDESNETWSLKQKEEQDLQHTQNPSGGDHGCSCRPPEVQKTNNKPPDQNSSLVHNASLLHRAQSCRLLYRRHNH